MLALHPIPTLRQHVLNKLCAGILLVAPSIVKCDAIVEYNDNGAMKMPGQPSWLRPMQGNNGSAPPTSLIPPLIPFMQPTKSTVSNAAAILLVPPSVPPSGQLSCPLLPCRPLPLSSCHAVLCCCCLRRAAHRRAAPCRCRPAVLPLAVLPNAIIVPPFIDVTLLLVRSSVPPSC